MFKIRQLLYRLGYKEIPHRHRGGQRCGTPHQPPHRAVCGELLSAPVFVSAQLGVERRVQFTMVLVDREACRSACVDQSASLDP